jgi:hypothetical protein
MELIGDRLRWLFTIVFYPAIVVGVLLCLLAAAVLLVIAAEGEARVRRLTAAVLPFVGLVFVLVPNQLDTAVIVRSLSLVYPLWRVAIGALAAVLLLELGRFLDRIDSEIGASLYVFLLSLSATFILYTVIERQLGNLHLFLLGTVIAGGFHVIFRGFPRSRQDFPVISLNIPRATNRKDAEPRHQADG